jgi:hypothetical protein
LEPSLHGGKHIAGIKEKMKYGEGSEGNTKRYDII